MAKPLYYSIASREQWFQDVHPNGSMAAIDKLVIHSTETSGWPSYDGGSVAPHLTARADFVEKRLVWRQHFDLGHWARALRNATGGVETNKDSVAQIEIVGTCNRKWSGGKTLEMWDLPDWALRDLATFVRWLRFGHGLKMNAPSVWTRYPGNDEARMSFAMWRAFKGVCGHLHVPENTHGDPGDFPIQDLLERAGDEVALTEKQTVDAVEKALRRNIAINTNGATPTVETISVADGLRMTDEKLDALLAVVRGLGQSVAMLTVNSEEVEQHLGRMADAVAALSEQVTGTGATALVTALEQELSALKVVISR